MTLVLKQWICDMEIDEFHFIYICKSAKASFNSHGVFIQTRVLHGKTNDMELFLSCLKGICLPLRDNSGIKILFSTANIRKNFYPSYMFYFLSVENTQLSNAPRNELFLKRVK